MRPDAKINTVRASMDNADVAIVHAKRLSADLRHDSFEALANGCAAGDDLNGAGCVDSYMRAVGGPQSAFFHECRQTNADKLTALATLGEFALQFIPLDRL